MSQSIPLSQIESSPAAKFKELGDKVSGRITAMEERQQTDISGNPLTFKDGSPRNQWVISLMKDDGDTIAVYAKGGKYQAAEGKGESMLTAIGSAVRAAGASAVDIGAELAIAYTGNAEPKPGQSPAKLYSASYRPAPAASVAVDDLFSE